MKTKYATPVALLALAASLQCFAAEVRDSGTTCMKDAVGKLLENGELPGCISIMYNDGVQETACLGYADVAAKRPIALDNTFMQCSQTKGFCGVTVAKLVEEGKLDLDDPVSKYLPEFKTLWVAKNNDDGTKTLTVATNTLTVRMVMNHTGGFPFELPAKAKDLPGGGWSRGMPLRQVAATAASMPLLFEPGTSMQYSNTGIDIGAAVVQTIVGMKWEDYLKKTVLDPLEMNDTWFWPTDAKLAEQIEMYEMKDGKPAKYVLQNGWQQRPYNDSTVFASAGAGLWTTANDQLKFYKMLMNLGLGDNGVRILKEETVKEILAKNTRPDAVAKQFDGYSLGLNAPVEDGDDQWFGHGGAWGTSCRVNWHRKQLKLWVVQNSNGSLPALKKSRQEAADRFFAAKTDNTGADAYTGRTE